MNDLKENNPEPVKMVTRKGAFGTAGYQLIVRKFTGEEEDGEPLVKADVYELLQGTEEEQKEAIETFRQEAMKDSTFASFTVLRFIEETRPYEAPPPKIFRPNGAQISRFGRSKYMPDGT